MKNKFSIEERLVYYRNLLEASTYVYQFSKDLSEDELDGIARDIRYFEFRIQDLSLRLAKVKMNEFRKHMKAVRGAEYRELNKKAP